MDAEKTGKIICQLRNEKNLTQKKLAEKLNVTDKALSKWERGDGCPDVEMLPRLAEKIKEKVSALHGEECVCACTSVDQLTN